MTTQENGLIVGRDIPNPFGKDLFSLRRSGAPTSYGNPYDPESLLSGEEDSRGCTYANSRRVWPSEWMFKQAVAGELDTQTILSLAPREILRPRRSIGEGVIAALLK